MVGKYLSKLGAAIAKPVGGIHDALWSPDDAANPAKWSQVEEYKNDPDLTWTGENMANTLAYYIAGTAVVVGGAAFALAKMKKPKVRYIRPKRRTTYRRRK